MRVSHLCLPLFFAAVLAYVASAAPRDPDLPRLDGKNEWHTIGPTAKTTQSKCIGRTTTPVCTIETAEACLVRHDERLCKIATRAAKAYMPDKSYRRPSPEQYRINRSFRINRANLPEWELGAKHHLRQLGDIEIQIVFRHCDSAECNPHGDSVSTYLLRPRHHHWYVVGQIGCVPADIGVPSGGSCSHGWPWGPPS